MGGSMALPLPALSVLCHSARQWLMGSCVLLQTLFLPFLLLCFSSEYLHSCIKRTFLSSCALFALPHSAMHFFSTSLLDLLFWASLYFSYFFPGPTSMLQSVCHLQQLPPFLTGTNSSKWTISAAQCPDGWQSINCTLTFCLLYPETSWIASFIKCWCDAWHCDPHFLIRSPKALSEYK